MMGVNVFLSYATADRAVAEHVARSLAQGGIEAKPFHVGAELGESWVEDLRSTLERSDAVVVLLSKDSSSSGFVMTELGAAMQLNKRIVAIRTDSDPLPLSLPHVLMIDAAGLSPDEIATIVRGSLDA